MPVIPGVLQDTNFDFIAGQTAAAPPFESHEIYNLDPHGLGHRVWNWADDDLEIGIEETIEAIFEGDIQTLVQEYHAHFYLNVPSARTGAQLPTSNNQLYFTFDVNVDHTSWWQGPPRSNGGRGRPRPRIVVGTDGFAYLTTSHYHHFERLSISPPIPLGISEE